MQGRRKAGLYERIQCEPGQGGIRPDEVAGLPARARGRLAELEGQGGKEKLVTLLAALAQRWFMADWQGWYPMGFELFMRHTRFGRAVRAEEQQAVLRFAGALLRPTDRILDVGAGSGHYTVALAGRCAQVTAVDASPRMRRYLADRLRREQVPNAVVRPGRIPEPLQAAGPFAGVVSIGVLNYIGDLPAALAALARPLSGGAWMVFTVPPDTPAGRRYARWEGLIRKRVYLRSDDEVRSALEAVGYRLQAAVTAADVIRVICAVPTTRHDAG